MFNSKLIYACGYQLGDKIETLVETVPDLQPFETAWDELTEDARENANALGIRLSGDPKNLGRISRLGTNLKSHTKAK